MDNSKNYKSMTNYLKCKNAPKGDPQTDLKTALYLYTVNNMLNLSFTPILRYIKKDLIANDFTGNLEYFTKKMLISLVEELESDGAITKLGDSSLYVASKDIVELESRVSMEIDKDVADYYDENALEKSAMYYTVYDGKKYRLLSDYVLLPNDVVQVEAVPRFDIAYVSKIVKARTGIVGRINVLRPGKNIRLMPDEPNLKIFNFCFPSEASMGEARSGDVVVARIIKRSKGQINVEANKVIKDIGRYQGIILGAVMRNDIPHSFSESVLSETKKIPEEVSACETEKRVDLRDLPLVTIDGEDARDFDDAVYCKKDGDNWRLYVCIADVSYYVKPHSAIDLEACNRANSCYFPNFVIPMLPEKLSNGICSLNPDVDRLCMTCELTIQADGTILDYAFYPAVMCSKARLTYTEAYEMITSGTSPYDEHQAVIPMVCELHKLYQAFNAARERRGGISIETQELQFVFDENMNISGVRPTERNDAHKLIEECMIAANVAAATFVSTHKCPSLYRVHDKPTEAKLERLVGIMAQYGLHLFNKEPTSMDFMHLVESAAKKPNASMLNETILMSMSKAKYSPVNIGHFGLALPYYAHFTSPIRRYADLQLHRVIKKILSKEHEEYDTFGARAYNNKELLVLGEKCTDREIAAQNAEFEVHDALSCIFMQQYIGEKFTGVITNVTHFGLFIKLPQFGVDGLLYCGSFKNYANYNSERGTLSVDGKVYALGMEIQVVVFAIDLEQRKISFVRPEDLSKKELLGLIKERDYLLSRELKTKRKEIKSTHEILAEIDDESMSRVAKNEDISIRNAH